MYSNLKYFLKIDIPGALATYVQISSIKRICSMYCVHKIDV